jgi:hypothetical protein
MTTNIYILKLEHNKWYIGKTDNIEKRFEDHLQGNGSQWTKKYKPISIEKILKNASPYDEDKYTIEYMGIYGINNVRGGIYVTESLDIQTRAEINKKIWGATDCCIRCGRKGHFVNSCKFDKDIDDNQIKGLIPVSEPIKEIPVKNITVYKQVKKTETSKKTETYLCSYCEKPFKTYKGAEIHENKYCKQKKQTKFSCKYCGKEFDTKKGTLYHENIYCKNKTPKITESESDEYIISDEYDEESDEESESEYDFVDACRCHRCGRQGHYANKCYAKKDTDGNYIDDDTEYC